MRDNPVEQVISDLFQYLESLETQSAAIGLWLKDKGLVTDDQLTHYLEQAGEASSVKWRAARVRMEHLFAAIPEPSKYPETSKEKAPQPEPEKQVKKEPAEKADKDQKEPNRVRNSVQQVSLQPHESPEDRPKESEEPQRERDSAAEINEEGRKSGFSAASVAQPSEKHQSDTKPKKAAEEGVEEDEGSGQKAA